MKKYLIILILFPVLNYGDPISIGLLTAIKTSMASLVSMESIMKSEHLQQFNTARDVLSSVRENVDYVYKNVKGAQELILFYNNLTFLNNTIIKIYNNIGKHKDLLVIEEIELLTHMIDYVSLELYSTNNSKYKFKKETLASEFENVVNYIENANKTKQNINFLELMKFLKSINEKILTINSDLELINKYAKYLLEKRRLKLGLYDIEVYDDIVRQQNLDKLQKIKKWNDLNNYQKYKL